MDCPAVRGHVKFHLRPLKPHEGREAPEKNLLLREGEQRVHHLPVKELEIRGVLHIQLRQAGDQGVKAPGAQPVQGGLLPPAALHALHHLKALFPQGEHPGQKLRRVLEVAVHHGRAFAPRPGEAREDRPILAEIPGEAHSPDAIVRLMGTEDGLPGSVPGAVVHENQLIGDPGVPEDAGHSPRRLLHRGLLIIGRYDNREKLVHF